MSGNEIQWLADSIRAVPFEHLDILNILREIPYLLGGATYDVCNEIHDERNRQKTAEGWTDEHDDGHRDGQLARAASCYAVADLCRGNWRNLLVNTKPGEFVRVWPWVGGFKPKGWRRDLVRAAALIVAEIERLDRAAEDSE